MLAMYQQEDEVNAHEATGRDSMNANLAALLYLVSGVLFILALRGLSQSRNSAGRAICLGMIGMAIAIVTTLAAHPPAGTIGLGAGRSSASPSAAASAR